MPLLYNFDVERPEELLAILAQNLQKRRLEKGLSREALTELSGVPTPTIAKFEQKHTISLVSRNFYLNRCLVQWRSWK